MAKGKMKKPEKGKKPKKITTKNPPGGPMTPGAKSVSQVAKEHGRGKQG